MSDRSFSTIVPGKWVLAGEHTVLRGGFAIALPHPEFRLQLTFEPTERPLAVEPDIASPIIHELLHIANAWLKKHGVDRENPKGHLTVTSTIPFGAGLGSSAALSVALSRWILSSTRLDPSLERELGREMENRFHGRSSGMDVAVVSLGEPIRFSMAEGAVPLDLPRIPEFVFVDTGLRASTRESIERVEAFRKRDPAQGERLDLEMRQATEEALEGLESGSLDSIEMGMRRAADVFRAWGLVPGEVEKQIEKSIQAGVRSPRLTGSGGGGYLVGLKGR